MTKPGETRVGANGKRNTIFSPTNCVGIANAAPTPIGCLARGRRMEYPLKGGWRPQEENISTPTHMTARNQKVWE